MTRRVGFALPGEPEPQPRPAPPTYEVSVVETRPGHEAVAQTACGGPATTAAWLRAVADQICPPRPLTRRGGGPD
ncbi:hypothetical protein AB0N38_10550 [Micromonospora aurantiaca]|uniref:hypothetical protein n=1 Tax=Micromonospora aurantiaca (nom. illeg.) TaxID=47850 RepID=UPI003447C6DC